MKFLPFRKIIFISIIIFSLLASGCNQQSQKPLDNKTKKPPQSLSEIEKNIDTIISSLDKQGKIDEKEDKKEQAQDVTSDNTKNSQNSQQSQNNQQGNQQQNKQGENQKQDSQNKNKDNQGGQKNTWKQVDKTVKQMHKKWNEFQPEAARSGVSRELIDGFDTTLNTLTTNIKDKNLASTLNNANNLYKYIPDFLSHYKDKTVNIKRLKYFTRDIMYKSRYNRWDEATSSMLDAKKLLPDIRSNADEQVKQLYESLEYSVYNLEKVTKQKQKNLVQIKGNIVLNNIKKIEKYNKKKEQNKQEEQ